MIVGSNSTKFSLPQTQDRVGTTTDIREGCNPNEHQAVQAFDSELWTRSESSAASLCRVCLGVLNLPPLNHLVLHTSVKVLAEDGEGFGGTRSPRSGDWPLELREGDTIQGAARTFVIETLGLKLPCEGESPDLVGGRSCETAARESWANEDDGGKDPGRRREEGGIYA
ncbi:unnamed protein product, partial [Choristocarpus tenellus]